MVVADQVKQAVNQKRRASEVKVTLNSFVWLSAFGTDMTMSPSTTGPGVASFSRRGNDRTSVSLHMPRCRRLRSFILVLPTNRTLSSAPSSRSCRSALVSSLSHLFRSMPFDL